MTSFANLLFDSVSVNTGDIAIGIANRQMFARHDIESRIIDPFSAAMPGRLIIGGGELIRSTGDDFYDAFRQPGPHILNAAGVWQSANDLSHLRDYAFVSGRSTVETETLQRWAPDAVTLPCSTTLLTSERYEIPGLRPGEPVVGIHVVPHTLRMIEELVPIIDAIPHRKVFIPFTHYNRDASFMRAMPFDREDAIILDRLDPLQLHSVIGQMTYVVVSSLHASIFAYSQNVPFASIWQRKAGDYFADRDLGDHMVKSGPDLRHVVDRLNNEEFDFTDRILTDREKIEKAFTNYAAILRDDTIEGAWQESGARSSAELDEMIFEQAQHVITDRDLALGVGEERRIALRAELETYRERLAAAEATLERIRRMPLFTFYAKAISLLSSIRDSVRKR